MRKLYRLLPLLCLIFAAGCSPVEKVKWGTVDLFGNRIKVRTIVSSIAGENGSVHWVRLEKINDDASDEVVATIRRGDGESKIHFLYDRSSGESRLINFMKNGEALSPFLIYKYLGINK